MVFEYNGPWFWCENSKHCILAFFIDGCIYDTCFWTRGIHSHWLHSCRGIHSRHWFGWMRPSFFLHSWYHAKRDYGLFLATLRNMCYDYELVMLASSAICIRNQLKQLLNTKYVVRFETRFKIFIHWFVYENVRFTLNCRFRMRLPLTAVESDLLLFRTTPIPAFQKYNPASLHFYHSHHEDYPFDDQLRRCCRK